MNSKQYNQCYLLGMAASFLTGNKKLNFHLGIKERKNKNFFFVFIFLIVLFQNGSNNKQINTFNKFNFGSATL